LLKLIRLKNKKDLPKTFLFHQIGYLFRPLWTYEVENKGSEVILYFYATGIETPKFINGSNLQLNHWDFISWNNYFVWDKYQKNFISKFSHNKPKIEIVGPIKFFSQKEFKISSKKNVAVFDVQPHRDSRHQLLGENNDYNNPSTVNFFLNDIFLVLSRYNLKLIHKKKRNIKSYRSLKYIKNLSNLSKNKNFTSIDPNISAYSLIDNCEITISFPFTSTSVYALLKGKITFYYDPLNIISKNDPAAHGVKIISGIKELKKWFKDYYIYTK